MRTRWFRVALAAVALCGAGAAVAADVLQVKVREAKVRSAPKHYKPAVDTVKYAEPVEVLATDAGAQGWLKVRTPRAHEGYLHESAVTDEDLPEPKAGSEFGAAGGVSQDEVALAGKGFNPQVEKKYRDKNPDLEGAFAEVDRMEKRKIEESDLDAFFQQGKLLDYGSKP